MKTFKDTVILRSDKNGKLTICDYNYYPDSEREKVLKEILAETDDVKEIEKKLKGKLLNLVVVDHKFENNEFEYSANLYDTLDEIFRKYELNLAFDDLSTEDLAEETEFSDMRCELEMRKREIEKEKMALKKRFKDFDGEEVIYLKGPAKYYRPRISQNMYTKSEIGTIYGLDIKEINKLHQDRKIIKNYENIEYGTQNKDNYDILDYSQIVKPVMCPGKKYRIPEKIDFLFNNLCNKNKESMDHLHKIILYKLKNVSSSNLPAVVLFGNGGAGKGLLMELLKSIFGSVNVAENLENETITGSFGFTGEFLAAEFAEITTHNTHNDKLMGNKLKNLIGSNTFEVNKKGIQKYKTKNVTWFLISSNDLKPLQLDVGTGNRRYSIIKVGPKIEKDLGDEIYRSFQNVKNVLQYVNWLEQEYGSKLPKTIDSLENKDKRDLEARAMNEIQMFWQQFADGYETGTKIRVTEVSDKLRTFCLDNDFDLKDCKKYLWNESPYVRKTIDIGGGKKVMGIVIE